SIPRDLETICLRAMAKEPARRYTTAAALAADLRRFLARPPIEARPVGRGGGLWRRGRGDKGLGRGAGLGAAAPLARAGRSAALAVREANAAERIGLAKRKTDEALGESRRLSARLALDRGLGLCEQGHADYGLLWLARGLQLAPADADELQRLLRLNLAGW